MTVLPIDKAIARVIDLPGWTWAIYSATGSQPVRVVVTSPDYKRHIGREAATVEAALKLVHQAVAAGASA